MRLLIAERDEQTRRFLVDNLAADGFEVYQAAGPTEAAALMERHSFDLCVVALNGMTLSFLDAHACKQPVVILAAHVDHRDIVRFLDRGADDVVVKPFSYTELLARIRATLRRGELAPVVIEPVPGLVIDPMAHLVTLDGEPVAMPKKEFAMLHLLASEPARVFTKAELERKIWGSSNGNSRTLDAHASRLRGKLGRHLVVNVWGVGYRLVDARVPAVA